MRKTSAAQLESTGRDLFLDRGKAASWLGKLQRIDGLRIDEPPLRLSPGLASAPRAALGELRVAEPPLTVVQCILKRLVDIGVASVGLLMLLPLLVVVAAAIKLTSSGPVIFRQKRGGHHGRPFVIYKFRTMTVLQDGAVTPQARKDDARVTALGRVLRKSSIDELPQLLNVLKGDMSLVGPRPHSLAHDNEYRLSIENYLCRHRVKPGITGWAQVIGLRGETARNELMAARVEADLWYINNWSMWLDVRIMLRTCVEVLRARCAY